MIEALQGFLSTVAWFLVVLTVVVFIHELGHYSVARWCGVKVDVFSIGFGREIFGFTARSGTRWKFSMVPLGGYVRFFGDTGASSEPDSVALNRMTADERAVSFHHKRVSQRIAIVAAGPLANFVLSIVILTGVFIFVGRPFTPPVVGTVVEDSAAADAGLLPGDRIIEIDASTIERFEDIREIVLFSPGETLELAIERNGGRVTLQATPRASEITDNFGNVHTIGLLGIGVAEREFVTLGPAYALIAAVQETYLLVHRTVVSLGEIVSGQRSPDELGGPIMIAQMSAERASHGIVSLLEFVVLLSASLGLINLFPIPVLDGGHLVFYSIEAVRGRPLGERAQEYGYFVGLAMVLSLMVFATLNDLTRPSMIEFFSRLTG